MKTMRQWRRRQPRRGRTVAAVAKRHLVPVSRAQVRPDDFRVFDFIALAVGILSILEPVFEYKNSGG